MGEVQTISFQVNRRGGGDLGYEGGKKNSMTEKNVV